MQLAKMLHALSTGGCDDKAHLPIHPIKTCIGVQRDCSQPLSQLLVCIHAAMACCAAASLKQPAKQSETRA